MINKYDIKQKCGVKPKINKGTDGNVFPYDSIRLPRHIIPLTYDLYLNPRIEEHTFDGMYMHIYIYVYRRVCIKNKHMIIN